jgi:hypothetical protein
MIAASGWSIFPVDHRKAPLCAHGFHEATTDDTQVDAWWAKHPTANIGFVPGRAGIVVLDVDVKHDSGGLETARKYRLLDIPTLRARTPSGGLHLYFRRPPGEKPIGNVGVFGPNSGVDVRCDGGYVVLPPSVLPSGEYEWDGDESDPAALPIEIARLLAALRPVVPPIVPSTRRWIGVGARLEQRIRAYMERLPAGLSEGQGRNNSMYALCAWLTHDLALTAGDARTWARSYNSRFECPLNERELEQTLLSAARHGARAHGAGLATVRHPRVRVFAANFGHAR